MVTIRCTSGISTQPVPREVGIPTTDIFSFPQGELEYSIYRPADGKGVNFDLAGYDEDDLEQAQALLNVLDAPTFGELSEAVLVFTEEPTQLTSASQAVHRTSQYYREVRNQYVQALCPPDRNHEDIISLGNIKVFMDTFIVIDQVDLTDPVLRRVRLELLQNSAEPYDLYISLDYIPQANITREVFNTKHDLLVISELRRQRAVKCKLFNDTGVIPEGDEIALASEVDVNTIGANRKPPAIRPEDRFSNIHAALDSSLQFYEYKQDVPVRHNNTFRYEAVDLATIQNSRVRFHTDFRVKDLEIVPYNINELA